MPDIFDREGLQLKSRDELLTQLTEDYRVIYGRDINIGSNSPDGQQINISTQLATDLREVLSRINSSNNIDNAEGRVLDLKVGLLRTARRQGSYSVVSIEIRTDRRIDFYGLNEPDRDPYTVQDNEGNQWQLINSISINGAATANFRASEQGPIVVRPGDITTAVTLIIGVTSINNASSQITTGVNEESDFNLRTRAKMGVSRTAMGFVEATELALKELPGMNDAIVLENNTAQTDANGTPRNTIWPIVEGSSTDEAIAGAIYAHRSGGCGQRGTLSHTLSFPGVTQTFTARWDVVKNQAAFALFEADHISGDNTLIDFSQVIQSIVDNIDLKIGQTINQNRIIGAVADNDILIEETEFISGRVLKMGHEADPGQVNRISFRLYYNGNASDLVTAADTDAEVIAKVKAVTGLANVTVTGALIGSPASVESFSIEFPETVTPLAPIGILETVSKSAFRAAPNNTIDVTEFIPQGGVTNFGLTRSPSNILSAINPSYKITLGTNNVFSKSINIEFESDLGSNRVDRLGEFTITVTGGVGPIYSITDYGNDSGTYKVVAANIASLSVIDSRVSNSRTLNAAVINVSGTELEITQRRIVITDVYGNKAQLDYTVVYP